VKEDLEREDNDTTPEIAVEDIKKRAVRGVIILTGRGFILNAISAIAQSLLWAFLGQYELGVFAIVSATISFLGYFSDIGLGAALVQKKDAPTERDLRTTFTIQQGLVLLGVIAVFLLAPNLSQSHNLSPEGRTLMYAFAISFFISSFRGIPTILLERKLDFVKYSIPSVIDTLVYNVVLVFLAARGFGIASYTYAVILRSLVGTIAVYALQPWRPGLAFSLQSIKSLFKFGLPYQLNSFISVIKDQGIIIFLGGIIQPVGVGLLDTSQRMINLPFRFFMDQVSKVTFPAFSRMQDDGDHLVVSVTRSIFFVSLLTFPVIAGFVLLSPILFDIIPQYNKWHAAVPILPLLAINAYFATVSNPLYNLLYAIGKVRQTMYLMLMWTVLTWVFVPPLAIRFGVMGVAIAMSLVGASSIVSILVAHKYVPFSYWNSFGKPLFASFIMILILFVIRPFVPHTIPGLGALIGAGVVSYVAAILALVGASLIDDAKRSLKIVFSK
jgi:O-antigen/teichoic acid export membrane protein